MTPDERNMLTELANKVAQTPTPPKDAEAEEFIRTQIGRRPDALYLMTQTVLIQNMALDQAQEQIRQLQQQLSSQTRPAGGGSFLGSQGGGYQQSSYAQPAAPPPPQYGSPQYAAPAPSGAPSFLRGAAQTAAGVAAGALAFEGIRSLFSHPGFGGSQFGGFGGGMGPEIVNNYYETNPLSEGHDSRVADSLSPHSDFADTKDSDVDDSTDADVNAADDYDYSDDTNSDDGSSDDFSDSGDSDNN